MVIAGVSNTGKTAWLLNIARNNKNVYYFNSEMEIGELKEKLHVELICEDELLSNVELTMLYSIKQHETVNDDLVIKPLFRIAWKVSMSDHGVKIIKHHAYN